MTTYSPSEAAEAPADPVRSGPGESPSDNGSMKPEAAERILPFRSLGAVAADAGLIAAAAREQSGNGTENGSAAGRGDTRFRCEMRQSPSGLLTEGAWEAGPGRADGILAPEQASAQARDRAFACWVHAEAKQLASRLERLLHPDIEPALSWQIRAVAAALWADAEWARRHLDGRFDDSG